MNKNKQLASKNIDALSYYPYVEDDLEDDDYLKVSIDDISSFGTVFSSIAPALKGILNENQNEKLFKMDTSNKQKINDDVKKLPINPSMMFMAITVSSINDKIDSIKATEEEILEFLKLKENKKLKTDVETLYQILDSYKNNWNNRLFKNNNYSLAVIVKKESVNTIKFYHEQIESKLGKKSGLKIDGRIKRKIKVMRNDFKNYEMALYIYALSSFLEVAFLENYQESFLKSVIKSIKKYEDDYIKLHKKWYEKIEKESKSSIQSYSLKGVAGINKVIGKTIAKIPKIRDGLVDEKLIENSEKVHNFNSKRTKTAMELFTKDPFAKVKPFVDNIELINSIYNENANILFDSENLYISTDDDD